MHLQTSYECVTYIRVFTKATATGDDDDDDDDDDGDDGEDASAMRISSQFFFPLFTFLFGNCEYRINGKANSKGL